MIKKAIVLGVAIAGMGLFASTAQAAPTQSRDVLDTQLVGPISITALSHNPRRLVMLPPAVNVHRHVSATASQAPTPTRQGPLIGLRARIR